MSTSSPVIHILFSLITCFQVNLTGGYHDAGDNIKFSLPMAFSMTILAYSILEYGSQLSAAGQLNYALATLQWGTDYFLRAHTAPNTLWGQVALYPS